MYRARPFAAAACANLRRGRLDEGLGLGWLHHWASGVDWFEFASIPFFTGIIGWLINWSGLWMLFSPITFHGFKVPGLREIATVIPRKLQEVPGIPDGGLGWLEAKRTEPASIFWKQKKST